MNSNYGTAKQAVVNPFAIGIISSVLETILKHIYGIKITSASANNIGVLSKGLKHMMMLESLLR